MYFGWQHMVQPTGRGEGEEGGCTGTLGPAYFGGSDWVGSGGPIQPDSRPGKMSLSLNLR